MNWQRLSYGVTVALFALFVAALLPILVIAVQRDACLTRLPDDQVAALGAQSDWRLDHGAYLSAEALFASEGVRPFAPAAGKVPAGRLLFFEDGYLWIKFQMPDLGGADRDLVVTLPDTRVRSARLILRTPHGVETHDWAFDQIDRRSGLGLTNVAFVLDRTHVAGATGYLAFKTYSASRGKVMVYTRAAYEQAQLQSGVWVGLMNGGALVLGLYLAVIGLRMRETSMLFAAAMAFTLGLRNLGAQGMLHSPLLQGHPNLADTLVYGLHTMPNSFWLVFLVAFLGLRQTAPVWSGVLLITAGLIPMQSLINILKGGFGWDIPLNMSAAVPTLFGTLLGMAFLLLRVVQGERRAQLFLLGWLPLGLATIGRVLPVLFVDLRIPLGPFEQPGLDILLSLTALAVMLTLNLQARETHLKVAAARSEQRFRDYAEIGQDGVIEVDSSGQISHAVGPLAAQLGLVPGVGVAQVLAALAEPCSGRREVELTAGRWLALDERSFTDAATAETGRRVILSDITDERTARDREGRRNTLAALGQLAGGIAHEVNNLLHPMINLTRRVQRLHGVDDEGQKLLDLVAKSGVRAGEIVSGVLKAYAPGRLQSVPQPLGQAVADAVETLRVGMPASCNITTQLDPLTAAPVVSGGEVLQVLSNLVSNAVKAMGGVGQISVVLHQRGPAVLTVHDTGMGMSAEMLARATTMFVTGGAGPGVGIGLAVVAEIVKTWAAQLTIDSVAGQGTTVTITFPSPTRGATEPEEQT